LKLFTDRGCAGIKMPRQRSENPAVEVDAVLSEALKAVKGVKVGTVNQDQAQTTNKLVNEEMEKEGGSLLIVETVAATRMGRHESYCVVGIRVRDGKDVLCICEGSGYGL